MTGASKSPGCLSCGKKRVMDLIMSGVMPDSALILASVFSSSRALADRSVSPSLLDQTVATSTWTNRAASAGTFLRPGGKAGGSAAAGRGAGTTRRTAVMAAAAASAAARTANPVAAVMAEYLG